MTFNDVEQARKNYHARIARGWRITAALVLVGVALGIIFFPVTGAFSIIPAVFLAFFAFFVGIIILALTSRKEATAYRKAYKGYFVEQNLRKIFTNLHYDHAVGIDKNFIRSTEMINTGDAFSSNDLTLATYKNVKFIQADATIQEEHEDSDGNTTYTTIFRGRFMVFQFPKKFNFKLELIGKKFYAYRVPGKDHETGRKMTKISTESSDFNRNFRIYGQDGFESFYLLDPAMIAKIEAIAERYGYRLLLGFLDNTLLVALNDGKDSFEPPRANKPLDEAAEMTKISTDIKVITDFVDDLGLSRKLFR